MVKAHNSTFLYSTHCIACSFFFLKYLPPQVLDVDAHHQHQQSQQGSSNSTCHQSSSEDYSAVWSGTLGGCGAGSVAECAVKDCCAIAVSCDNCAGSDTSASCSSSAGSGNSAGSGIWGNRQNARSQIWWWKLGQSIQWIYNPCIEVKIESPFVVYLGWWS